MDETQALTAFAALSQQTRLRLLRALVIAGPDGLSAGALAENLAISASNASFHLKELQQANLITPRRDKQSIIYTAAFAGLADLIRFLTEDCCQGRPEICDAARLPACCTA